MFHGCFTECFRSVPWVFHWAHFVFSKYSVPWNTVFACVISAQQIMKILWTLSPDAIKWVAPLFHYQVLKVFETRSTDIQRRIWKIFIIIYSQKICIPKRAGHAYRSSARKHVFEVVNKDTTGAMETLKHCFYCKH